MGGQDGPAISTFHLLDVGHELLPDESGISRRDSFNQFFLGHPANTHGAAPVLELIGMPLASVPCHTSVGTALFTAHIDNWRQVFDMLYTFNRKTTLKVPMPNDIEAKAGTAKNQILAEWSTWHVLHDPRNTKRIQQRTSLGD